MNLEFCQHILSTHLVNTFSKNTALSNFMKIRTVGARLLHEDRWTDRQTEGRTDMTKLIVAFNKFANAPNNKLERKWERNDLTFFETRLMSWYLPKETE